MAENNHLFSRPELSYRQIWDISVDGMRLTDESGKILAVNKAFCQLVGMKEDELINQPFSIIYDRDEREAASKLYKTDLQNNALKTHFESERYLWNGKKVWLEFSNSFITTDDSKRIVLSIINDITERKRAELDLSKSEKRYRVLFNNGNDAVFVNHLRQDNSFDKFIEVNDVACLRLGYRREELLHMHLPEIIHERYEK
jgi:PAS domain S-box-containing protein